MSLHIRPAQITDRHIVRNIVRQALINPLGLDWRRFGVAEIDGQIIGVGQIKPHRDGSRELASIAIARKHQGQGIGGAIIRALLGNEAPPIYLMCAARLATYYPRFGFQVIERIQMPPYFRRMHLLMNLLTRKDRPRLVIMRWDG